MMKKEEGKKRTTTKTRATGNYWSTSEKKFMWYINSYRKSGKTKSVCVCLDVCVCVCVCVVLCCVVCVCVYVTERE